MKRRSLETAWGLVHFVLGVAATGCGGPGAEPSTEQAAGTDAAPTTIVDAQTSSVTDSRPRTTPGPVDAGTLSPTGDAGAPETMDSGGAADHHAIVNLPLTGCADNGYSARFTIGGQPFDLIVDTGSGTLAVASTQCPSCMVTPEYSPGTTATDQNVQTSSVYGTGSWKGEVYSDAVDLVGFAPQVTMKIGAIRSQTQFFSDAGCGLGAVPYAPQGIAGFGPKGLTGKDTDALLPKLAANGAPSGVFAVEMCPMGGQLMMGGVDFDAGAATGPGIFTPMVRSPYYAVTLNDLQIGGKSVGFGPANFGTTIVDTGSTQVVLPTAVYNAVTSAIESATAFVTAFGPDKSWFNQGTCSTSSLTRAKLDAQLPTLTLVFPDVNGGNSAVTFKATDSYLPPTDLSGMTYYCSSIGASASSGITILGDAVLSTHLVVFDTDKQQIGFVPQSYCR